MKLCVLKWCVSLAVIASVVLTGGLASAQSAAGLTAKPLAEALTRPAIRQNTYTPAEWKHERLRDRLRQLGLPV